MNAVTTVTTVTIMQFVTTPLVVLLAPAIQGTLAMERIVQVNISHNKTIIEVALGATAYLYSLLVTMVTPPL